MYISQIDVYRQIDRQVDKQVQVGLYIGSYIQIKKRQIDQYIVISHSKQVRVYFKHQYLGKIHRFLVKCIVYSWEHTKREGQIRIGQDIILVVHSLLSLEVNGHRNQVIEIRVGLRLGWGHSQFRNGLDRRYRQRERERGGRKERERRGRGGGDRVRRDSAVIDIGRVAF